MKIIECITDKQIKELALLAGEIWHDYFIDIITKEQIDYMVDQFQSYHAIKEAITNNHYTYFLGYINDRLVGYCGVKPEEERLFLSKLYLHKEYRGQGLASILFNHAVNYGKALNKKAIYLTCNKYNQHSLDVYYHKGFYKIDSVQTDIGQGFIMDDYVLQLDF